MVTRHRLKQAIEDLLDGTLALQVAVDRHFASSFQQTVNGVAVDREAFVAGIESLRPQLKEARVTVLDEVAEEMQYAQHHRIELRFRDESRVAREVYVFAVLDAEMRFVRIDEATLQVL